MNRSRLLFFGTLIGAATGLAAAMLLSRRAERSQRETAITTGEGLKLGVLILGFLRAIMVLTDDK